MEFPLLVTGEKKSMGTSFSKDLEKKALLDPPLQELNVANKGVSSIPDTISGVHEVKRFIASNNNIKYVSPNISALTKCVKLNLTNNKIVDVPESISQMSSLEELNLSLNKIKELPRGFALLSLPPL
jgi:internalin A